MSEPAERDRSQGAGILVMLVLLAALPACSMMFPHTELTIAREGTTLDELGISIIADIERWFDTLIFALGLMGL